MAQHQHGQYPAELRGLTAKEEKRAQGDYDRRRRKRNWRIARRIGYVAIPAAVGIGLLVNHSNHDRAVNAAEHLGKAHARDRIELALPYDHPAITGVTDTHQVTDGNDGVRVKFHLPLTAEAKKVRSKYAHSNTVNWLDTPGIVAYSVRTVHQQPMISPLRDQHEPGMLDGSLFFPQQVDPAAEPRFDEPFQGRNAGAQPETHGDNATVIVEIPTTDQPGSELALFASNSATSTQNGYLVGTQAEQYVGTLRLVRDANGGEHWQQMQQPPQFPDMYGETYDKAPHGATL